MGYVEIHAPNETPYMVVPYLIKKVGDTENIGFRVYQGLVRIAEFNELKKLGEWFVNTLVDMTFEMEPEK